MTAQAAPSLLVVVLAAGQASRFGTPKQLALYAGQTLLQGAVTRAMGLSAAQVAVVLGAGAAELAPVVGNTTATLLLNRYWNEGMASSLRLAVEQADGRHDGLLITLVDQPAVTLADLRRLQALWLQHPDEWVAAAYQGTHGAPAIIPARSFAQVRALRGDEGARRLLTAQAGRLLSVPMPAAAADVDTPADLLALQAQGPPSPTA